MPPLTLRPPPPPPGGRASLPSDNPGERDGKPVLLVNLAITVVLVIAVGFAAILLARTVTVARAIDGKAQNIAKSGRGINLSTDSIIQLNRTNDLATEILRYTGPLDAQLTNVVGTAQSIRGSASTINNKAKSINSIAGAINGSAGVINQSARSINGSAGSINSTAGAINGTAGQINSVARAINGTAGTIGNSARNINRTAGAILSVARLINRDADAINDALDSTISLARAVKVDTGNILNQALDADDTSACIDNKLVGGGGDPADCKGR